MKQIKNLLLVLLAFLIALPLAAQEERTIKRKVAIGRFSNETQYAKGLFYDQAHDPMRKQALDILSSKLAALLSIVLPDIPVIFFSVFATNSPFKRVSFTA